MGVIPPFNAQQNGQGNQGNPGQPNQLNQPSPQNSGYTPIGQPNNMSNTGNQQQPGDISSAPFHTGIPLADALLNKQFANPAYTQKMTQGFDWAHSTPDYKSYALAQAAGAGIDPSEALHALASGKTVPQLLEEHGFDPKNPPPVDYMPTRENVAKLKQRQAALKEVDVLSDFVTNGLGPYFRTFEGMSPLQMRDALVGKNKQQQIDFLAARGLAPELSNLRLLLAQGKIGITAVKEMMNKSMMDVGAFQGLVSPDVFTAAQKLMSSKLGEAFHKSEEVYNVGQNRNHGSSSSGKNNDPIGIR